MFPAVALALLLCPFPLQVFLSSLRNPLQLRNPDRGLLLAMGSLLVYYVTPQLFRPFTSPLVPSSPSWVPSSPSWVPFYHHRSRLIFHGPPFLHGSPSIFTGPLPFSRVPFHFHRSPPLLHGSPSIFTAPFQFHGSHPLLHGSPSIFTGPLPFSRVPSSPSQVPFCLQGTRQMSLYHMGK